MTVINYNSILKNLDKKKAEYASNWMSSNPYVAFLVSVGAGPWKETRRYNVQKKAVDWYLSKNINDFSELSRKPNVYPFSWQNNFLNNLRLNLKKNNKTFTEYCEVWKAHPDWKKSLKEFFEMCGTSEKGVKVLWMFARDYLGLPSFPIDRWVLRTLKEHKLPENPYEIIDLCNEAGVCPNNLNRKLFQGVNPDWSTYV